jgi:hypothetical protein
MGSTGCDNSPHPRPGPPDALPISFFSPRSPRGRGLGEGANVCSHYCLMIFNRTSVLGLFWIV